MSTCEFKAIRRTDSFVTPATGWVSLMIWSGKRILNLPLGHGHKEFKSTVQHLNFNWDTESGLFRIATIFCNLFRKKRSNLYLLLFPLRQNLHNLVNISIKIFITIIFCTTVI